MYSNKFHQSSVTVNTKSDRDLRNKCLALVKVLPDAGCWEEHKLRTITLFELTYSKTWWFVNKVFTMNVLFSHKVTYYKRGIIDESNIWQKHYWRDSEYHMVTTHACSNNGSINDIHLNNLHQQFLEICQIIKLK